MCSTALKKFTRIEWKNLRNVNSTHTLTFYHFDGLIRDNVNTGTPHLKVPRFQALFLYRAFRYSRDKNIGQSAMTLIAERRTPRFFKVN